MKTSSERSKCYERMSYLYNYCYYTRSFWRNCIGSNRGISTDIAWRSGCRKSCRPSLVHLGHYYLITNNSTKATCQDEPSNIKLHLRHVGNRLKRWNFDRRMQLFCFQCCFVTKISYFCPQIRPRVVSLTY